MPTPEQIMTMSSLIENFTVGRLNISKNRYYLPKSVGGLGLIKIDEFLIAQQVTWVKKASLSTRDNWRVDLTRLFGGNCLVASKNHIDNTRHPILYGIASSYESFLKIFNNKDRNLSNSYLLHNPSLCRGRRNVGLIDYNFLRTMSPG